MTFETSGESSIRYYGSTDVPLSSLGEAQMRRVGQALAHERFDAVLSSRLRRARRALEALLRRLLLAGREPADRGAVGGRQDVVR